MKKLNVIMLLAILFLSTNSFANVLLPHDNNLEQFQLDSETGNSMPRSAIEQIVTGTIYNQSILTLNISINDILNVKIFDEFGSLLYTGTYSPSNPSAITVDVSSWDSGKYKVTLRKISNEPFIYGEFTIH